MLIVYLRLKLSFIFKELFTKLTHQNALLYCVHLKKKKKSQLVILNHSRTSCLPCSFNQMYVWPTTISTPEYTHHIGAKQRLSSLGVVMSSHHTALWARVWWVQWGRGHPKLKWRWIFCPVGLSSLWSGPAWGLNHQLAISQPSSQSGWGPRMQALLGGTLGDFLSKGSSHSRNMILPLVQK